MRKKYIFLLTVAVFIGVYLFTIKRGAPNWEQYNFPVVLRNQYFQVYSTISQKETEDQLRLATLFLEHIDKNFFSVQKDFPIFILLFLDKTAFQTFFQKELHQKNPPAFGVYFSNLHTFLTYPDSGIGTMAHELTHALMRKNLPYSPRWAEEGIASFFEKFYGYEEHGNLIAEWGFQNPWRLRELGETLPYLRLEDILENKTGTSEKRMLTTFLFQQRKFKEYLLLVQKNDKRGYATFLEAVFARPLLEITPFWQEYLNAVSQQKERFLQIPPSQLFSSKESFGAFKMTEQYIR